MSNDLISIPLGLGLLLQEELMKFNIKPRVDKHGMRAPLFTREELEMITSLNFENPTSGVIMGRTRKKRTCFQYQMKMLVLFQNAKV